MVLMPAWIKFLKSSHIGQQVRADGPESHLGEAGHAHHGRRHHARSPSLFTALARCGRPTPETFALLIATVPHGLPSGLIDDAREGGQGALLSGLTPKAKLVGPVSSSPRCSCLVAVNVLGIAPTVEIPFVVHARLWRAHHAVSAPWHRVPWLYLLFVDILLVGMCNAVNLTDGLDGLAAGTVMIVMIVMAAIAYRSDVLDSAIFAAALAGACVGLSLVQLATRPTSSWATPARLPSAWRSAALPCSPRPSSSSLVIGGLFVAEALSVMIQVFYYKKTHKRIFLMAPLAPSLREEKGWSGDEGRRALLDRLRRAGRARLRRVLRRNLDGGGIGYGEQEDACRQETCSRKLWAASSCSAWASPAMMPSITSWRSSVAAWPSWQCSAGSRMPPPMRMRARRATAAQSSSSARAR